MAPSINYDTPDYQRGVTNAQVLLTNILSGVGHVTIGVPPNAGTLIVVAADAPSSVLFCQGLTTGLFYPCVESVGRGAGGFAGTQFFINAASVLDEQVTITWGSAPIQPWQVYADSGAHIVADVSKRIDQDGVQYVLPTIPSTTTRYHPLNEVIISGGVIGATGIVIPAPAAGSRIRLFSASLATFDTTAAMWLEDTVSTNRLIQVLGVAALATTIPAQGCPLTAGASITCGMSTAPNGGAYSIYYTVEVI